MLYYSDRIKSETKSVVQNRNRRWQPVTEMDCRTAESMVTRFIDHSLSMNELEGFLDHIEHLSLIHI